MGQDLLDSVLAHKDQLLAQKGVELPTVLPAELMPMLRKGLGSGPGAGALSPEQQQLLRKMLPAHSETQHPTRLPVAEFLSEAPKPPPVRSTDGPAMMTQAANENEPSTTTIVTTTMDKETEPDVLPSGKHKHFRVGYKEISAL